MKGLVRCAALLCGAISCGGIAGGTSATLPADAGSKDSGVTETGCGAPATASQLASSSGALTGIMPIAVDATSVYWFSKDALERVPVQGGAPTTLAPGLPTPQFLGVGLGSAYLTAGLFSPYSNLQALDAVSTAGGPLTTVLMGATAGFAVDDANVYWIESTGNLQDAIEQRPLAGGPAVTVATNQTEAYALALDATDIYWTVQGSQAADGSIAKAPIGGGPVTVLASGQARPSVLTVAAGYVYWIDSAGAPPALGSVNRIPIGGGPVELLADQQLNAVSIAVDGSFVYWVTAGQLPHNVETPGAILALPLGGGCVRTLYPSPYTPYGLALDATHVYFTTLGDSKGEGGGVWVLSK